MRIGTVLARPAHPADRRHTRPSPARIVVGYGFWIFILSDIVMFSALFATYAVLSGNTAGGPSGAELFDLRNAFILTMCLLVSSYTCGLGALSAERLRPDAFLIFAALTFVFGAAFLFLEVSEFARMIREGAGPSRIFSQPFRARCAVAVDESAVSPSRRNGAACSIDGNPGTSSNDIGVGALLAIQRPATKDLQPRRRCHSEGSRLPCNTASTWMPSDSIA